MKLAKKIHNVEMSKKNFLTTKKKEYVDFIFYDPYSHFFRGTQKSHVKYIL